MKLFVVALNEEVNDELLKEFNIQSINNTNYYFSKLNSDFAFIFSDVGKVNAAISLTKAICDLKNVELIINIGSCGCANKKINILQTCLVSSAQFLDVDLSGFGYQLNQMRSNPKLFETNKIINEKIKNIINIEHQNCIVGSSDSFISKNNYKKFLDIKNIDLIDMELASLCATANKFNIPIISIKVVSDSLFNKKQSISEYQENQKVFNRLISCYILKIIQELNA